MVATSGLTFRIAQRGYLGLVMGAHSVEVITSHQACRDDHARNTIVGIGTASRTGVAG
jgi:hypothetical protein